MEKFFAEHQVERLKTLLHVTTSEAESVVEHISGKEGLEAANRLMTLLYMMDEELDKMEEKHGTAKG